MNEFDIKRFRLEVDVGREDLARLITVWRKLRGLLLQEAASTLDIEAEDLLAFEEGRSAIPCDDLYRMAKIYRGGEAEIMDVLLSEFLK